MNDIQIDENVLIIRVSKLYYPEISDDELYEITRGIWLVAGPRREQVEFVFSVFQGFVKEVYKVDSWHPALTTAYKIRKQEDFSNINGRWEFSGKPAEPNIQNKYINKSVAFLFPQGAANPVRYINC